jgi:hypothetical protein
MRVCCVLCMCICSREPCVVRGACVASGQQPAAATSSSSQQPAASSQQISSSSAQRAARSSEERRRPAAHGPSPKTAKTPDPSSYIADNRIGGGLGLGACGCMKCLLGWGWGLTSCDGRRPQSLLSLPSSSGPLSLPLHPAFAPTSANSP